MSARREQSLSRVEPADAATAEYLRARRRACEREPTSPPQLAFEGFGEDSAALARAEPRTRRPRRERAATEGRRTTGEGDQLAEVGGTPASAPASRSRVTRAAAVKSRSIRWAWTGRLALGYLTVVTGVEGVGKSVFMAWMIARLTRGELPGEWQGDPIDALIVAGEDGIADTWRPRLELADADLDRVSFLNLDEQLAGFNIQDGIDELAGALSETGARFLTIDAVMDHMPPAKGGESVNSPTFVRQAVAPLKRLVRELEIVGSFGLHPPKARSADFRDLVQNSQAFSAVPRVGLLFAYHPDDPPEASERRRVVLRGKGNAGRDPGALEFRIVGRPFKHDDGRTTEREVVVDVVPSAVTLADLAPDKIDASRDTKQQRAAEVIREALGDGDWHLAAPIRKQLATERLDSGSVRTRAIRLAKVETRKRPGERDGPWEWRRIPESDGEGSNGSGPFPDTRARCLPDVGLFDSGTENTSSNGKGPRVHDQRPTNTQAAKSPPDGDSALARADATAPAADVPAAYDPRGDFA